MKWNGRRKMGEKGINIKQKKPMKKEKKRGGRQRSRHGEEGGRHQREDRDEKK